MKSIKENILSNDTAKFSSREQDYFTNYTNAEKKAHWYLQEIQTLAEDPNTFKRLHNDFRTYWRQKKNASSASTKLMQKAAVSDISTWTFLEKLSARKELDSYLNKTISYIFLRDLGLDLNEKQAQKLVQKSVDSIIKQVESGTLSNTASDIRFFQPWLDKRDTQPAYYWLMLKISSLKSLFIEDDARKHGLRKLIKVVAGTVMHFMLTAKESQKSNPDEIQNVVKLGYAYGLTYPFIDDLLDKNGILTGPDKDLFSDALRRSLQHKKVVDYPNFENNSIQLKRIYSELKWAFEYIQFALPEHQAAIFFKRAGIFFEAQNIDGKRLLKDASEYELQQLLTTVVLKSASSRLISRDLVSAEQDKGFDHRTFCFGIYNQFNDDIKDIEEDTIAHNLTPYTWYLKNSTGANWNRPNPYHYYWAVIYFLVYNIYANNKMIKALFFERTMNAHKSVLLSQGKEKYHDLCCSLMSVPLTEFDKEFHAQVQSAHRVVWFDKLLSNEVATWVEQRHQQSQSFKDRYENLRERINANLHINNHRNFSNGKLHDVANYVTSAGGKRIRAVIACAISEDLYGFNQEQLVAVTQLLEYMHSASLILDDLPSQDDASIRRGKSTAHKKFGSVAKAELSSVYLMMKAIELQSNITQHPPEAVLASLAYASSVTQAICEGQWLDIETSGKPVSHECLEKICQNKTGLAIEAALIIPAILAQQDEVHIQQLKSLARHMGLMFQIRDDLLDQSSNEIMLGKPVGADAKLKRMNFVSVNGQSKAIEIMLMHYQSAQKIVNGVPNLSSFFNELLDYIIYRTK